MITLVGFILSLLGYLNFWKRRWAINYRLGLILTLSAKTLLIYLFALFGYLNLGNQVAFWSGVLFFLFYWFRERKVVFTIKRSSFYYILPPLILAAVCFIGLGSHRLEHYDNFSHWALVVKYLFTQGHLPLASDAMIGFYTYPLGTSLFINYMVQLFSFTEPTMLRAQLFLILAASLAIFAKDKGREKYRFSLSLVLTLILSLMVVFNGAPLDELLVDFVVTIQGLALAAGVVYLRHRPKSMILYTVVVGGHLTIIKSSAIFFAIIGLILATYYLMTNGRQRPFVNLLASLSTMALSMGPIILWNLHIDLAFAGREASKHSVNVSNYSEIFADKSPALVRQIVGHFFQRITDLSALPTLAFLLTISLWLFFTWSLFRYRKTYQYFNYLGLITLVVVAYMASLLAMYLFSMPVPEALDLAAFDRYTFTLIGYILGLLAILVVENTPHLGQIFPKRRIGLAFALVAVVATFNFANLAQESPTHEVAQFIQETVPEQMELDYQSYLVVNKIPRSTSDYVNYLLDYYLFTPNVTVRPANQLQDVNPHVYDRVSDLQP